MQRRQGALGTMTAVLILLGGCSTPTTDAEREAMRGGEPATVAPVADAGIARLAQRPMEEPREAGPTDGVQCEHGFPSIVCDGRCAGQRQGCCVTGVRPLGVCRALDECAEQCAFDCGVYADRHGAEAGLHCEALCTWIRPEISCRPDR